MPKLSFEQAKSNLANAVRQVSQLNYTVKQLKSAVRANEITLAQAQGNLNRRVQLVKDGAIDKESFQHAKEAVELAKANLTTSQNQLGANQALLLDGPLSEQPQIQSAVSNLKQAWLNLERTKIRSPIKGVCGSSQCASRTSGFCWWRINGSGHYRSNVVRRQLQRNTINPYANWSTG